eukprot:scaffold87620_cov69-Cyclotella_meneghiniana.AAC.2
MAVGMKRRPSPLTKQTCAASTDPTMIIQHRQCRTTIILDTKTTEDMADIMEITMAEGEIRRPHKNTRHYYGHSFAHPQPYGHPNQYHQHHTPRPQQQRPPPPSNPYIAHRPPSNPYVKPVNARTPGVVRNPYLKVLPNRQQPAGGTSMETPRHIGDVTRGSMSDYSMNAACRGKENQVCLYSIDGTTTDGKIMTLPFKDEYRKEPMKPKAQSAPATDTK